MQTELGSWSIALGIDWTMPSDASEVRAEKKMRPKHSHVLMSSATGQRWLGFHEPVSGKVYAGALLVAMVKPNAVVYQPLNDTHAWVCAIRDGMPAPGYDKVLPASEGRNAAIELSSVFQEAEMIGAISGAQASLADVFGVLDEGLSTKSIQKRQIAVALLSTGGHPAMKIVAGVAALVIAGGLAYGVTWYLDVSEQQKNGQLSLEEAARQAMASAQTQARQEAERQAAQASFKGQIEAARIAQNIGPDSIAFWSGVNRIRRAIPHTIRGYKPQSYDCTPQACRVSWLGQGRFVSVADKLKLPNVERNLTSDLMAASVFPMSVGTAQLPRTGAQSADELRFQLQSMFALNLKSFSVDAPVPQSVAALPTAGLPPVVVAHVGKWRAQMVGSSAVLDVTPILQRMARYPIRVTSIKYQPGPGSVDLEGEFVFMSEQ